MKSRTLKVEGRKREALSRAGRVLFAAAVSTNAIAFSQPVRFAEALESTAVRTVLPTTLSSAELEAIDPQILEHARFSAQTAHAGYLDDWDHLLDRYLAGELDKATFRVLAREKLDAIGYQAKAGEKGSIKDLASELRLNLRIETDAQFARGYGTWKHDQQPVILDAWPAQELFRAAEPKGGPSARRPWKQRWLDAGGKTFEGGRMIALRNDPIWVNISRFGLPYPPFDYASHMRTRLIARRKAMEIGLIDRDAQIPPQDRDFARDLRFTPQIRSQALRESLLTNYPELEFREDVLTLKEAA